MIFINILFDLKLTSTEAVVYSTCVCKHTVSGNHGYGSSTCFTSAAEVIPCLVLALVQTNAIGVCVCVSQDTHTHQHRLRGIYSNEFH